MKHTFSWFLVGLALTAAMSWLSCGGGGSKAISYIDSTIKLPDGFTATTLAEGYGGSRHIAVAPNGAVFVKLAGLHDGKGIFRFMDTNDDGHADTSLGFGDYTGTGIAIRDGYLYASSDTCVYRYKLDTGFNVTDPDHPEKIVTGLLSRHE